MTNLIDELIMMWPCCYCFSFGFVFSLCSLGLSFCVSNICISEAKKSFLNSIDILNEYVFEKRDLHLSYHQKCSTSWLEIKICKPYYKNFNDQNNNFNIVVNNQIENF